MPNPTRLLFLLVAFALVVCVQADGHARGGHGLGKRRVVERGLEGELEDRERRSPGRERDLGESLSSLHLSCCLNDWAV